MRAAGESDYAAYPMTLIDPAEDLWEAYIPAQLAGTEVQYYIHATANSGKTQNRPLVAPEGYFNFRVRSINSAPVANIFIDGNTICVDQSVQFFDNSNGAIENYQWSFPGGQPETSDLENPVVLYSASGEYDVTLIVSNDIGSDTLTLSAAVNVESGVEPFFDDFTTGPNPNWMLDNPTGDDAEWAPSNNIACHGNGLFIDNFNTDTRGTSDFVRARLDLTNLTNASLEFDVAYAPYNNQFFDRLKVHVEDCENNLVTLFDKEGSILATAPATTDAFEPSSCDEWRNETVDLSAFDGQVILLVFENDGGYGNQLYIDNINVTSSDIVNQAPTITLVEPVDGTVIENELPTIPVIAEAADADGTVNSVDFFVNGDLIGTVETPPYQVDFTIPEYDLFTFSAIATDNDGAQTSSDLADINVVLTSSTQDRSASNGKISVSPVPTKDQLQIQVQLTQPQITTWMLLDALGQQVLSGNWDIHTSTFNTQIDLSQLPAGTYFLKASQLTTERIVIVR